MIITMLTLKRGEGVAGYNYFDDDDVNRKRESKLGDALLYASAWAKNLKNSKGGVLSLDDLVHGETIKELKEMPNLRALFLKLLAFILFLIAVGIFIFGFAHTINSQNRKSDRYFQDAGNVCTEAIVNYGSSKWDYLNEETYGEDMAYLTGLCYARQMDFDDDGNDELMLCYNNGTEYILEVWSYIGKDFTNIYSESVNHTGDVTDGSWISFYHKNNKYFICKSEPDTPEKVVIYALKGDAFKKHSECDYDYKNDIYSIKGKISAYDFETIKLSVIKSSKADSIVDLVTTTIQGFSTSADLLDDAKSEEQLKAAAYYDVVSRKIKKYGNPKFKHEDGIDFVDGVSYVKQIDFNNDGNTELIIVYRKMIKKSTTDNRTGNSIVIESPAYCAEVYGWNGTIAKKLFYTDSLSRYYGTDTTYYLMLQKSGDNTNICINDYTFTSQTSYNASSKIYALEGESFEATYSASKNVEYGWSTYYINGERLYDESQFRSRGFEVPLFLNDEDTYDSSEYTVIYMSGKDGVDYGKIEADTIKQIQQLNKNYNPEMKID